MVQSVNQTRSATNPSPRVTYQWVFNLDEVNSCQYDALSFPSLQKRWQKFKPRGKLLGVVALKENKVVGLVIGECFSNAPTAEILSLFVQPESRHQGIATSLVQYLEQGVRKANYSVLQVAYQATDLTKLALEPLLAKCNWELPETQMVLAIGITQTISQAPWINKYSLSPEFTLFPWSELTQEDRQQIQQRQAQKKWYPEILSPFSPDPRLEPLNSLGLRYNGEVIGWMLTHRVAPDTIRYSTLFVDQRFQRSGKAILLLAESIKRQVNSPIPYGKFAVSIHNAAMLRIVERHLSPYLTHQTESRLAQKTLVPNHSE